MDRHQIEKLNKQTIERYNKRLVEHGPGAYALGWNNEGFQRRRFIDLIHSLKDDDLKDKEILDVGCGLADLYAFLKERCLQPKKYIGIDINGEFLRLANQRYPECTLEVRDLHLSPYETPVADTGIILGVLNFRVPDHEQYAQEMIQLAFTAVRQVLVVNAISDVHNDDYPREDSIYYFKPATWLQFGQTLTPYCSLIQDYKALPQNEFMLILRKTPRTVS